MFMVTRTGMAIDEVAGAFDEAVFTPTERPTIPMPRGAVERPHPPSRSEHVASRLEQIAADLRAGRLAVEERDEGDVAGVVLVIQRDAQRRL